MSDKSLNKIYQGKFQEQADKVEPGSVDLILTDPPYGKMVGIDNNEGYGRVDGDGHKWDNTIKPSKFYDTANKILRKNGRLILFSQETYTSQLIQRAIPNLPFNYRMMWVKNDFANGLLCNSAPVNYFEDILVFTKQDPTHETNFIHPLRGYFVKVKRFIGKSKTKIMDKIGQKADHTFRVNSTQFSLCTQETYQELIDTFAIDKMENFRKYSELEQVDEHIKNKTSSTFNLPEGKNYKPNVLEYAKDYDGYHPTQKPVALLEDLIKTYTNEDDLVVDLTAGSGSTGVAAQNCNREYILIEQKQEYVEIARDRIKEVQKESKVSRGEMTAENISIHNPDERGSEVQKELI